jgi:hypothetical protein
MATEEIIDIHCSRCHATIAGSTNEWRQLGGSLIAPLQYTWYKALMVHEQIFLATEDHSYNNISEASCAQCGSVVGQGFEGADAEDATLDEYVSERSTCMTQLTYEVINPSLSLRPFFSKVLFLEGKYFRL